MTTLQVILRLVFVVFLLLMTLVVVALTFMGWWIMRIHPPVGAYTMTGLTVAAFVIVVMFLNEAALQIGSLFEEKRLHMDDLD